MFKEDFAYYLALKIREKCTKVEYCSQLEFFLQSHFGSEAASFKFIQIHAIHIQVIKIHCWHQRHQQFFVAKILNRKQEVFQLLR